MKLIKDLVDDRIVYYWTIEEGVISPMLASLELASEWYVKFVHEGYTGEERRTSLIDRRRLYTKRDKTRNTEILPTNPIGRRKTDVGVVVAEDISADKIQKLVELINYYDKLEQEK